VLVSLLCDYERVEAPKTSDDAFEAARTDCVVSCPYGYGTSGLLRAICLPCTRAGLLGQGDEAVKGKTHARQGKTCFTPSTLDTLTTAASGVLGPRDPR
jgi:hypothetical protein